MDETRRYSAGDIIGAILLFPFTFPILLIYGLWLIAVSFPERKKFDASLVKTKLGLSYKHSLFKSDEYRLANIMLERGAKIEILERKRAPYCVCYEDSAYFFGVEVFFSQQGGATMVSDDGDPSVPLSEFLKQFDDAFARKTIMVVFKEKCTDLEGEEIDIQDERLVVGIDYEDIADQIYKPR